MMQRSRKPLIAGAASLLAATWQLGAAPVALAQVTTPEVMSEVMSPGPNLVAPPPGTNEAKAEEAPASSLTTPSLTGPLTANPNPFSFETGFPLGKVYAGGAISGIGLFQSNPVPGNHSATGDASNALVWLQNSDGPFQFFAMAGGYSFPTLGTPYFHLSKITGDTFGPVPVTYGKLVATEELSLQFGKLPTLIGAEYAFTFQNMNIERGLLWNQEPIISRGLQGNYSSGPLTVSLSLNDGFYSNNYNWVSGLVSYALNKENTIAVAGGGAYQETPKSTFVTPVVQNNSRIINAIYTYNAEPWTITPYFQYTDVPSSARLSNLSVQTYGGAVLANYKLTDNINIAGRGEYIASSGAGNVLYGSGSSAGSLTLTPTYQIGVWFVRGEGSVVHAFDSTAGFAFGKSGNEKTQLRGLIEAGIVF
jgi:hypothetical protein